MKSEYTLPAVVSLALLSTVGFLVYREGREQPGDSMVATQREVYRRQVETDRALVTESSRVLTHTVIDSTTGRRQVHKGTASDLEWLTHYNRLASQSSLIIRTALHQQSRSQAQEHELQERLIAEQEGSTAKTARTDYDSRMNQNVQYGLQQKHLEVHLRRLGDGAEDRAEVARAQREAQKQGWERQMGKAQDQAQEDSTE